MGRVIALVRASHPEPVAAVTAGVTLLCFAAGKGWWSLVAGGAVLTGQLFTGWVNDYLDRGADREAGRVAKPIVSGAVGERVVAAAALVALAVCVPLSAAYGLVAGVAHLFAVAWAGAYNAGLKATPLSVVPYAIAFGLVPAFVTLGGPDVHLPPGWLMVSAAALGAGAHFVQVLPDIESDLRLGMRGLPDLAGRRLSVLAAAVLLGVAVGLEVLEGKAELAVRVGLGILEGGLVGGMVLAGLGRRDRLAFRLCLGAAGVAAIAFFFQGSSLAG